MIHRTVYGTHGINDGYPKLLALAFSTLYLFVHCIWIAGTFDHEPEFFIVNGLRCFLGSQLLYAVGTGIATLALIVKHQFSETTPKLPILRKPIDAFLSRLWAFFPQPAMPEPEPEPLRPTREEIFQQCMDDAKREYSELIGMLNRSGLDAMEKEAVSQQLKQQYLKAMRGIIQQ